VYHPVKEELMSAIAPDILATSIRASWPVVSQPVKEELGTERWVEPAEGDER